ncbi:hypothetical protein CDCA_CDCA14G3748 [Cyanidium caldarium]|uniref:Uncharacterized protein n=1 Tax=Cyanidium caldarium TaxID=2771 RepID=A0AAV9J112_CYACA|nr:hypothetical protein CDCA_CDCA14G3748 [Cyanidium caldarium]
MRPIRYYFGDREAPRREENEKRTATSEVSKSRGGKRPCKGSTGPPTAKRRMRRRGESAAAGSAVQLSVWKWPVTDPSGGEGGKVATFGVDAVAQVCPEDDLSGAVAESVLFRKFDAGAETEALDGEEEWSDADITGGDASVRSGDEPRNLPVQEDDDSPAPSTSASPLDTAVRGEDVPTPDTDATHAHSHFTLFPHGVRLATLPVMNKRPRKRPRQLPERSASLPLLCAFRGLLTDTSWAQAHLSDLLADIGACHGHLPNSPADRCDLRPMQLRALQRLISADITKSGTTAPSLLQSFDANNGPPSRQSCRPRPAEFVRAFSAALVAATLCSSHQALSLRELLQHAENAALLATDRYLHTSIASMHAARLFSAALEALSQHQWRQHRTPLLFRLACHDALCGTLQEQRRLFLAIPAFGRSRWLQQRWSVAFLSRWHAGPPTAPVEQPLSAAVRDALAVDAAPLIRLAATFLHRSLTSPHIPHGILPPHTCLEWVESIALALDTLLLDPPGATAATNASDVRALDAAVAQLSRATRLLSHADGYRVRGRLPVLRRKLQDWHALLETE